MKPTDVHLSSGVARLVWELEVTEDHAEVSDFQTFLSQQDALSEALASTTDSMTAALTALSAAPAG